MIILIWLGIGLIGTVIGLLCDWVFYGSKWSDFEYSDLEFVGFAIISGPVTLAISIYHLWLAIVGYMRR